MNLFKNITPALLFLGVLLVLNSCNERHDKLTPVVQNGRIDLADWSFKNDGPLELKGQWEFYWHHLYQTTDFRNNETAKPDYIKIRALWDKSLNKNYAQMGYGTYRLNIFANSGKQYLKLYSKIAIYSSAKFFINGKPIGGNGVVGKSSEKSISSYYTSTEPFQLKPGENELIIQVSNFEKNRRGGLLFCPKIGELHDIARLDKKILIVNLLIIGGILIFIIYHFALFIMRRDNNSALYFALFSLSLFLYFISQYALQYFISDYGMIRNIRTFGWTMSIPAFILLLKSIFPKEINNWMLKFVIVISIGSYISYLLKIKHTFDFYRMITILTGLYIILIAVFAYVRKRESAKIFLLSMVFVALTGINDALLHLGIIESVNLSQFGLFFFLIIQSYLLSARFSTAYKKNKTMSDELAYVNKNLEKRVLERTRKIEEQNIQLEKLIATKDKFFSIIAHDLRGPVGNLSTSLGLLTDEYEKLDEKTKQGLLLDLKKSSDKTYQLLENLLLWSQVQRKSIAYKPNNIVLNDLVAENIDLMKLNAQNKQIDISTSIPKGLKIYADSYMVDMILRNLLHNAIKFTPDEGKISILAYKDDKKVEIAISDTGIGIKKENLAKLFRIEHNYFATGTNGEKGSGLGLILCKELIEKHHGNIIVKSESGKGTTFLFSLPNSSQN